MTLGPTHWNWRPDVGDIAWRLARQHHGVSPNTYVGHPWPGWDGRSIDFWGPGGRGDALTVATAHQLRRAIHTMQGGPALRHTILGHRLWTSFGGWSFWEPEDHRGRLRHLHVTYW